MRLVALIEDEFVAKQILDHLGLSSRAPPHRPPRRDGQQLLDLDPTAEYDCVDPPYIDAGPNTFPPTARCDSLGERVRSAGPGVSHLTDRATSADDDKRATTSILVADVPCHGRNRAGHSPYARAKRAASSALTAFRPFSI